MAEIRSRAFVMWQTKNVDLQNRRDGMPSLEAYDVIRAGLIVGQVVVCLHLIFYLIKYRKTVPTPVKLLGMAIISLSVYMIDAAIAAIQADVPFRWRLLFWLWGLFMSYLYIFMPKTKRHFWDDTPKSDVV